MLTLDALRARAATGEEGQAGSTILDGVSLTVAAGEVHAVMGPNGAGKSTLCHVLAGSDGFEVVAGTASFKGQDLLAMEPEERAAAGMFLSFQYPVDIPGVPVLTFLRTAVNAQRRARGEEEMSAPEFLRRARAAAATLKIPAEMLKRPVNVGFSGGEKKRLEVFQILITEPSLLLLDETDSGLDIDALRLIAENIDALRGGGRAMLIVTHYQRLLQHLRPDRVHVMVSGRILASGGPELAKRIERTGYAALAGADPVSA